MKREAIWDQDDGPNLGRRWMPLITWAISGEAEPSFGRKVVLKLARKGMKLEYGAWRARMSAIMWITDPNTRFAGYTLSSLKKRFRKGRRP